MTNGRRTITEMLMKHLGLDFSSFSFFSLISVKTSYKWCWTPFCQPLTPIYRKMRGGGCTVARPGELLGPLEITCSPKRAGYFISKFPNGPRGWKMPPKWPFCPHFEYLAHFLLKRHKTLRIVQKLTLSSLIRPTRIQMLANDHPRRN